jgi:hypothetical protein
MSRTYFKEFATSKNAPHHHRKIAGGLNRMMKRNKKSGYIIVVCYVKPEAVSQIARTKGGMFKVMAERLGKQYKLFIFPSTGDERMEAWYRGKKVDMIQQKIYSAANLTMEGMLQFAAGVVPDQEIHIRPMDEEVKKVFNAFGNRK